MSRVMSDSKQSLAPWELRTEPTLASALWVLDGEARLPADAERRHALRAKLAAGELDELVFEACVFRAVYPNRNYLRFRDEDLEAFAASFVGQPFLRDHNAYELEARGGTVRASWLERARVDAADRADRAARHRSVFESDDRPLLDRLVLDAAAVFRVWNEWLSRECNHWPGRKYGGRSSDGEWQEEVLCELVFVQPAGKETSAVNAPAVGGTGVRGVLAELMAAKEANWGG